MSTSIGIKNFPFSCACAYACICTAASDDMPTKHNTSTRIFTTRGHVWPVKNSGSSYSSECSDEFACAHVCVVFRFHLGRPYCLRLCFASPVKTRLKSRFGVKTSMSGKLGTALSNFGTRPCSASVQTQVEHAKSSLL